MAGHQANLYSDKPDGQSVDRSVRFYLEAGVHPTKLVIGMSDLPYTMYETDEIHRFARLWTGFRQHQRNWFAFLRYRGRVVGGWYVGL